MKKITVLCILCLTLSLLAGCNFLVKTGTLKGHVTGELNGEVMANVAVTVFNQTVLTDENGNYTLKVKAGNFTMKAERSDTYRYSAPVTITADQETVHNIVMTYPLLNGMVTDSQGGAPIADVNVTWKDHTAKTDANGKFTIKINKGEVADMLLTKEGRAATKIQDLSSNVVTDTVFGSSVLEIPMRKPNSPYKSSEAPSATLKVKNASGNFVTVRPGRQLSGTLNFLQTVESENDIFVMYAWVGTMQRGPRDLYQSDVTEAEWSLDSTKIPNGKTYIRTLSYDNNENAVMMIIPVVISNAKNDSAVPGDMTVLNAWSYAFGKNLGFYNKDKVTGPTYRIPEMTMPNGDKFKPTVAAPGANMYVKLSWAPVAGADGYEVYRSFGNEENYELIGYSKSNGYDEYSGQLEALTSIYYKVVPYNSKGKGKELVREVYILPSHNVLLETPANGATDVELSPTLVWDLNPSEQFPVGTYFYQKVHVWDSTDYMIWEAELEAMFESEEDVTDHFGVKYPSTLQPGGIYSWDVIVSWADYLAYYDEDGYSYSQTFSGEYYFDDYGDLVGTGSANGEAVFTTELQ